MLGATGVAQSVFRLRIDAGDAAGDFLAGQADSVTPRETTSAAEAVSAPTLLAISFVAMLCSSTAEAIVRETSFTSLTTPPIEPIDSMA